jgi:hypothetical protein
MDEARQVMRMRRMSIRTEEAYLRWIEQKSRSLPQTAARQVGPSGGNRGAGPGGAERGHGAASAKRASARPVEFD